MQEFQIGSSFGAIFDNFQFSGHNSHENLNIASHIGVSNLLKPLICLPKRIKATSETINVSIITIKSKPKMIMETKTK